MSSLKILFLGVILPGALSAGIYDALIDGDEEHVRVHRSVVVDGEEIARAVEAELAAVEAEVAAVERQVEREVAMVEREVVVAARAVGQACEHSRSELSRLGADALSELRVTAGAGAMAVEGRADVDEVTVHATLCASDEALLEGMRVGLTEEGARAVVETEYPRTRGGSSYARIDLEIDVPLGMAAELEDGSGEIRVAGTGETRISDGSGEIEVRGIDGSLVVRDGSGEIVAREIGGDVEIVDGSGEVAVHDVTGAVRLTDGSGGIAATGVGGDVQVRADGSGSISVRDVGGDFVVRADGSGSISHRDVRGSVRVPRNKR